MSFAPELVGTYQDSEGGVGRHRSSPPLSERRIEIQRAQNSAQFSGLGGERRSSTSCSISQPLSFGAFQGGISAGLIVEPELFAMVVDEIALGGVPMQMSFGDVE